MKMLFILLLAAITVTTPAYGDTWTPQVEFSLEGGSYKQTLIFISGFSYAVTEIARNMSSVGLKQTYCLPPCRIIGSKLLLEILNEKYAGESITSEQAALAMMNGLKHRFPCDAST